MERVFVEHYSSTGDANYAAQKAGYAHPDQRAAQNLAKPSIRDAAAQRSAERLETDLVPKALSFFAEVLEPGNPHGFKDEIRFKVSDSVLKHSRATKADSGDVKDLHDYSLAELHALSYASQTRIEQLNAELGVIEHEPADQADSEGIFG